MRRRLGSGGGSLALVLLLTVPGCPPGSGGADGINTHQATILLDNLGGFDLEDGIPQERSGGSAISAPLGMVRSGSISIDPADVTVTAAGNSKRGVLEQGATRLELTVRISSPDDQGESCASGTEYGAFVFELDNNLQVVSVDPPFLPLVQETLATIREFRVCLRAVLFGVDGQVTVRALNILVEFQEDSSNLNGNDDDLGDDDENENGGDGNDNGSDDNGNDNGIDDDNLNENGQVNGNDNGQGNDNANGNDNDDDDDSGNCNPACGFQNGFPEGMAAAAICNVNFPSDTNNPQGSSTDGSDCATNEDCEDGDDCTEHECVTEISFCTSTRIFGCLSVPPQVRNGDQVFIEFDHSIVSSTVNGQPTAEDGVVWVPQGLTPGPLTLRIEWENRPGSDPERGCHLIDVEVIP